MSGVCKCNARRSDSERLARLTLLEQYEWEEWLTHNGDRRHRVDRGGFVYFVVRDIKRIQS